MNSRTLTGEDGDMGRYRLVPDRFKTYQYSHAPRGQMSEALREEIRLQVRELRRGRTP